MACRAVTWSRVLGYYGKARLHPGGLRRGSLHFTLRSKGRLACHAKLKAKHGDPRGIFIGLRSTNPRYPACKAGRPSSKKKEPHL